MVLPLMPKATAVWLIENTTLDFTQIAQFCGMHPLEVQGIADGEVAVGIVGKSPIESGQLTREEIARCEKDKKATLNISDDARKYAAKRTKGGRYTPVARRQDKPDAIAWLLKHYPAISDTTLVRLIGTTKSTIEAIRSKTHWNSTHIKPKDPVMLGLCTQTDLEAAVDKINKAAESGEESVAAITPIKPRAKKLAGVKTSGAKKPASQT